MTNKIVLASRSGVRKKILNQNGIDCEIIPANVDEKIINSWVSEGLIEFLGFTEDVRPFLMDCDCMVLPSYYREGTPKALLEAAAMARPIITTDWIGCRDVVDHGVNGFLCPARNYKVLADQMLKIIQLPKLQRDKMGQKSREKVEREYDENSHKILNY